MANPVYRHRLYVIQDSTILSLAANPRMVELLPFLRSVNRVTKKGCGVCGGAKQIANSTIAAAKLAIAGLPTDRKAALKQQLSAQQVRITYRKPDGRVVELTF